MNEAQKIADAVLASVEGEDLLIEAMARVLCQLYGGEDWMSWRPQAHAMVVMIAYYVGQETERPMIASWLKRRKRICKEV